MKRLEAFPMDVYMAYTKTWAHTFQHEAECFSNFFLVAPTSKRNWKQHIQTKPPNSLTASFFHKTILQTSGPFLESELARGDWQDKCPPKITWMGHGICGAYRIYHVGWIQWIVEKLCSNKSESFQKQFLVSNSKDQRANPYLNI